MDLAGHILTPVLFILTKTITLIGVGEMILFAREKFAKVCSCEGTRIHLSRKDCPFNGSGVLIEYRQEQIEFSAK